MKKQLLTLALLAATLPSFAGGNNPVWHLADAGSQTPRIAAESFLTYNLLFDDLAAALKTAPQDPQRAIPVSLPMPDGRFETFLVWETPISTGELYTKYPGLMTYTGTQQNNPQTTVKLDMGEGFFHAMILEGSGAQYFIDPFSVANDGRYIVYDRANLSLSGRQKMVCELEAARPVPNTGGPSALTSNGLTKRTYRLALACTGEYAQAATGLASPTKAQVLAKMVTSINRVNGIYEKELSATMQLISNTDTLIFLNGNTDPYTNNSGGAMLSQNQTAVTSRIGSANYDIGHVFSTGGGGIASLGSLCSNGVKAQGVTGSPSPVGDAFDVDYVAHEMGHQFGGEHTFNEDDPNNQNSSCYGNAEQSAAYEPGSGSTIMAYAGICTNGDNVQNNSDAYFHAYSLNQTTTKISSVPTCGVTAVTGNAVPVVAQTAVTYNIPWYTPFELTANTVTGTAVTYCWEQYDLGNFGALYSNAASAGPVWRSAFPNASPTRVFPSLTTLIKNQTGGVGDQLTTVGRTMRFLLTVRNVANGLGVFNSATNGLVTVKTIKAADTFRILNFASPATLAGGSQQTLLWDVSNSASAPISCSNVDIYYSIDSGRTWPYTLATSVPNNGSASVIIPNITTARGRLKVKASNNVFFAINRAILRVNFDPQSVSNVSKELQTKVYPVPAKDLLNIVLPEGISGVQALLYNNMGQQVWTGTFENATSTFSVQGYPAGTYYFRLQNVEKAFGETVPFVIQ